MYAPGMHNCSIIVQKSKKKILINSSNYVGLKKNTIMKVKKINHICMLHLISLCLFVLVYKTQKQKQKLEAALK